MALDKREPATFAALYAPYGDQRRYESTAKNQAARQLAEEWMGWLRQKAGLTSRLGSAGRGQGQVSVRRSVARPSESLATSDALAHRPSQHDQADPGERPGRQEGDRRGVSPPSDDVRPLRQCSGPSRRSPSAATIGTSPNSTTSPSLNSCSARE